MLKSKTSVHAHRRNLDAAHPSHNKSHHKPMAQVKIKRVKRNSKTLTTKEKILAGLGVGGAMMGVMAPLASQQQATQRVSLQTAGQQLNNIFGIPSAEAQQALLVLSSSSLSLQSNQSSTVTATVNGVAAGQSDITAATSDNTIASVIIDGSGNIIVTAADNTNSSAENATITIHPTSAGSDTSQDQTIAVAVAPDNGVENQEADLALSSSSLSLQSNQSSTVTATVNGVAAGQSDITASSSNNSVASVSVDSSGNIIVTAADNTTTSPENATITVHPTLAGSDTSQDQTIAITVAPDNGVENQEADLVLSSTNLSLSSNQNATVTATVNGIATAQSDLSVSSSNSGVASATVNSNGQIIVTAGNNSTSSNQTATITVHPTLAGSDTSQDGTISVTVAGSGVGVNPSFTSFSLGSGTTNSSYGAQVQATGNSSLTFSLNGGSLPPGLVMSGSGFISGTPSSAGVYSFNVLVTDQQGHTATSQFSIAIFSGNTGGGGGGNQGLIGIYFVNSYMPAGSVNQSYSSQVPGYSAYPLTYQLANGSLPPGLTLNSNGVLSGTPTTTGSYNFGIQATNQQGGNTTGQFNMTINPAISGVQIGNGQQTGTGFVGLQIPAGYPASAGGSATQGTQNQGYQYGVNQSAGGVQLPNSINLPNSGTVAGSNINGGTYVVKKGDTLWAISKKYYGDGRQWRTILSANPRCLSIAGNTRTLRIGYTLTIPSMQK